MDNLPKMGCGVWMTLDLLLHKDQPKPNFWEHREEVLKKPVVKRRERLKLRSKAMIFFITKAASLSQSSTTDDNNISQEQQITNDENTAVTTTGEGLEINKSPPIDQNLAAEKLKIFKKKFKARINRKIKYNTIIKHSKENKEFLEHLKTPIDCRLNLPRANVQLERLMGTNVVRLTDRIYMLELRERIYNDFEEMLGKRIATRETKEAERQRNLAMEYTTLPASVQHANNSILNRNPKTNNFVFKYQRVKTHRSRNAEKLQRQEAKWEKEHLIAEELNRQKNEAIKARRVQSLINNENHYYESKFENLIKLSRLHKKELIRIGSKECVNDFKTISESILKNKLCDSIKAKERTNDYAINEDKAQKERLPSTTKLPELSQQSNEAIVDNLSNSQEIIIETTNRNKTNRSRKSDQSDIDDKYSVRSNEYSEMSMEDPMITLLKKTDNVKEMYNLGEDIISGHYILKDKTNEVTENSTSK